MIHFEKTFIIHIKRIEETLVLKWIQIDPNNLEGSMVKFEAATLIKSCSIHDYCVCLYSIFYHSVFRFILAQAVGVPVGPRSEG